MSAGPEPLMTTGELAKVAGVSLITVSRWCDAGMWHLLTPDGWRLTSVAAMGRWLVRRRDLIERRLIAAPVRERLCRLADLYERYDTEVQP